MKARVNMNARNGGRNEERGDLFYMKVIRLLPFNVKSQKGESNNWNS